jgi:hypothetical protein
MGGWVRRARVLGVVVDGTVFGMGCSCGWNANKIFPAGRMAGGAAHCWVLREQAPAVVGCPLVGSGGGLLSHRTARGQNPGVWGVVVVGAR